VGEPLLIRGCITRRQPRRGLCKHPLGRTGGRECIHETVAFLGKLDCDQQQEKGKAFVGVSAFPSLVVSWSVPKHGPSNPVSQETRLPSPFRGGLFGRLHTGEPLADDWGALIRQVKEANDIVDVVGGYMSLRPAGPTFKGLCPFHDDHRPSFDVDPRRQRYRCWSCQKHGDVITFVEEQERVDFREALELLARRAGITLEKRTESPQYRSRALMLEVVRWAAEQYHRCLLDSPLAEAARRYLGERQLTGDTVRRFGIGYAPAAGDWLVQRTAPAGISLALLENVGLVAVRQEGQGYYDRFRDRIIFPIRNVRGQAVGFGGRILPRSPFADRAPKYYNSCDTPLFAKSEQLYGLDQARSAATEAGYLAVVEGYTDVLMAHQLGVAQVVATMGTALNARHVQQLRRFVPRVVLVFDADAGGSTGVDRALQVFVSQNVDLAIATLPQGLDPCDLLVEQGPEPFRAALVKAVDALEFKLQHVLAADAAQGVDGRRRAVEAVLGVIALAPEIAGPESAIKQQLLLSRIAQRLALQEETVWARLKELRDGVRERQRKHAEAQPGKGGESDAGTRSAPAAAYERELLEVLLAEPALVPLAAAEVQPEQIQHPGLRELLRGLYDLQAAGEPPTLDLLRVRIENPRLAAKAMDLQDLGRKNPDRPGWLRRILAEFRLKHQVEPRQQELKNQLQAASDHETALELLRRLQNPN
jgi:DNA primase